MKTIILIAILIGVLYFGSKLAFTEDKTVFGFDTNKLIDYGKLFGNKTS